MTLSFLPNSEICHHIKRHSEFLTIHVDVSLKTDRQSDRYPHSDRQIDRCIDRSTLHSSLLNTW